MPETTAESAATTATSAEATEATEPKSTETTPKKKFDPEKPDPDTIRACRSLTVRGIPCRQRTVKGTDFCVKHFDRNKVTLSTGDRVAVPLLEDDSAIQLMLTKILSGLLNGEIAGPIASKSIYCCQVAHSNIKRAERQKSGDMPAPVPEPVAELHLDYAGNLIGPREQYRGPTGTFEPQWSFSKFMYEKECDELGQIRPTCAADFPASGWLTEEEMKETPEQWKERTKGRQLALYEKCKAVERERNPERFYLPSPESKSEPKPKPNPEPSTQPTATPNPAPSSEPSSESSPAPSAGRKPEPRDRNNPDASKSTVSRHQPCACGGLYGGDPCDECLDRQQRSAPPATDYTPYTGSFDLKASAEAEGCSPDRSTLNAKRCPDRFDVVEVVNKPNPMIPKARKITHKGGTLSRRPKCTKTTATLPLLSLDESATRFFASGGPEVGFEIRLRKNLVTPGGV
jgi:hypothetical protein